MSDAEPTKPTASPSPRLAMATIAALAATMGAEEATGLLSKPSQQSGQPLGGPREDGAPKPAADPTPPVRPRYLRLTAVVVYDLDQRRGKDRASFFDRIRSMRRSNIMCSLPADDGTPIQGAIIASTVRVDGPRIIADIEIAIQPWHRVSRTFGIPDDEVAIAAHAAKTATAESQTEMATPPKTE